MKSADYCFLSIQMYTTFDYKPLCYDSSISLQLTKIQFRDYERKKNHTQKNDCSNRYIHPPMISSKTTNIGMQAQESAIYTFRTGFICQAHRIHELYAVSDGKKGKLCLFFKNIFKISVSHTYVPQLYKESTILQPILP